jgi:hypothetical protein
MSLDNIQKARFLNTIFKMYYALGQEPSYNDISILYGQYFNRNKPGQPVKLDYDDLNASNLIDHEKLNRIMTTTLFNVDVLYDSFHEEVEALYEAVSSYKFRIDYLRSKRAEVEKKVDDHLFSLKNTDGFYYSTSNAFNDTETTDLNFTSALVDTEVRKVTIPKLSSSLFNYIGNILNTPRNATVEIFFDGQQKSITNGVDFSNVFNGLNNSRWSYVSSDGTNGHKSNTVGVCVLKITIPISSSDQNGISTVEGRLISTKQVDTSVLLVDGQDRANSVFASKSGSSDYDVFSFHFDPKVCSSVELYLTKVEPDYINADIDQSLKYTYNFTIDELVIASPYYDASAIYVSNPVSIPSEQNSSIMIDAVSIETNDNMPAGCNINYYIAEDVSNAQQLNDFNWLPISPTNASGLLNEKIVSFNGAALRSKNVIEPTGNSILPSDTDLVKIPRLTLNHNPIESYFYQNDYNNIGFNLYRFVKMPTGVDPITPYILENVNSNQIKMNIVSGTSLNQSGWQEILSGYRNDIVPTFSNRSVPNSQEFFSTGSSEINYGSMHLATNIYSQATSSITKNFLKSIDAQYWDIEIYLNGSLLSKIEPGVLSKSITWNIRAGQNSLVIIINKSTNGSSGTETAFVGSFSLFDGLSILNIPGIKVYQDYLFYVKIEDLRNLYSNTDNVFSVINYENNKEIVYRREKEIGIGSVVYYYENLNNGITTLRLRADLMRGQSAYSAPSINSYKIKFKH